MRTYKRPLRKGVEGTPLARRTLDFYIQEGDGSRIKEKIKDIINTKLNEDLPPPPLRVEEDVKIWFPGASETFVDHVEGYLLEVRYDGRLGKAVCFMLTDDGRLVKWVDKTDHKPYFLTDLEPKNIAEHGDAVSQVNYVTKLHPIRRQKQKLWKIITRDPLAVRELRGTVIKEGGRVWEADIRYHHNYIFDNLLVPGMKYRASSRWERIDEVDEKIISEMSTLLSEPTESIYGESLERSAMIAELTKIFEQRPPKVPRVALDVEMYTPEPGKVPDPDEAIYPIISAALADTNGRVKVLVLHREGVRMEGEIPSEVTEVEIFDSERALLLELLRELENYPVVLTFNGDAFDLPYIFNRLLLLGLERSSIPMEASDDMVTFRHILHIDLYKLFSIKALQVYAFGSKYRELRLESISRALLNMDKIALEDSVSAVSLDRLIAYNARDAVLTLKLTTFSNELVWNLIIMISRISKLGIEDVTRHQVSTWIRGLMNWEHRRRGWLIPSREELGEGEARSRATIKDKKYRGAIVLEPPVGVFFDVVVLDYASLYPSIIKSWNLSYETINRQSCENERQVPEVNHRVCMDFRGITSEIVGLLRDYRVRVYKKRAKETRDEDMRKWYDAVQSALKVYINASYGVFGNENFPFYSLAVAESVTAIGRSVLMSTLQMARENSIEIIYGDTDSIFAWSPGEEALAKMIEHVARNHALELEMDKRFRFVLFGGLKKNYLGITEKGEIVVKGMVGKKSNTPEFIKTEFMNVVEILKEMKDPESFPTTLQRIREHILEVNRKVKNMGYTLDELAIRVMLSKDPEKYVKTIPQHVKAAKILSRQVPVSKGTIISFVKTRDSMEVKPVLLAKLSEVDTNKYIEYVRTAFEQILESFGVTWEEMSGGRSLSRLLGSSDR